MKQQTEYWICVLIVMLFVACLGKTKELPVLLSPEKAALEDYFPRYQEVFSDPEETLLFKDCPEPHPDSSYSYLGIKLQGTVKPDQVACLAVRLSKILEVEEIEKGNIYPDGSVPIQAATKQSLFMEYYELGSEFDSGLVRIPNLFYEDGKYELSYGIFLKKDSLEKKLQLYDNVCKYSVGD